MLAAARLVATHFELRGYRPGQDHSSRIPVRVTRLAIQDAFDWFDPGPHRTGNNRSDEQLAPYFQAIWTPVRNRQQPGPSRLMGRRSLLLPVVTCGTLSDVASLRGEGTSYQSLQPTNCQLRAPCETVEFPGRLPTCAGPTTVFGPCSSTRTDCGGSGTTPSTLTPVSRFLDGVPGPGWCRGIGVPRAPATTIVFASPTRGCPSPVTAGHDPR